MPTRVLQILHQGNGETLHGQVLDPAGQPMPLAGHTLRMVIKASEFTPDDEATTLTTEDGIAHGQDEGSYTVTIPASMLTEAGIRWYRVDAQEGQGDPKTVVFGPLIIRDM